MGSVAWWQVLLCGAGASLLTLLVQYQIERKQREHLRQKEVDASAASVLVAEIKAASEFRKEMQDRVAALEKALSDERASHDDLRAKYETVCREHTLLKSENAEQRREIETLQCQVRELQCLPKEASR